MRLLDPASAILAAALTVPILLLFYLLKLRRKPLKISSTLLWHTAVHDLQANVPFRWLKQSWLLYLHVLIFALLAIAYGRPAIAPHGKGQQRIVVLIDRSASMAARDGRTDTRLQEAKASARDLIEQALSGGDAAVALMSFAAEPRIDVSFTTDRSLLIDTVNALTSTDQPADLPAALKLIEAVVAGDSGERELVRAAAVVIISDGSFDSSEGLTLGGATFSLRRVGPDPTAESDGPDNLGFTAFAASRDYNDPATVRVLARVANASRIARDAAISLTLADAVVDRRPLRVPGATEQAPGEASIVFEIKSASGGIARAVIEREDDLKADNSAATVLTPGRRPRIMLVRPTSEAASAGSWLLADALAELDSESFRAVGPGEYTALADAGVLRESDLIVFDRVTPAAMPPLPTISFGAPVPIRGFQFQPNAESPDPPAQFILAWKRSHPVLRDVALDAVSLTSPLTMSWTQPPSPTAPEAVELATGATGPLMALVQDAGVRRIVVAFDIGRTNWALQVGFPVFIAAAVDFLTMRASEQAGRACTTGTAPEVTIATASRSLTVFGPVGSAAGGEAPVRTVVDLPEQPAGEERRVSLGRVDRAGVYSVEAGQDRQFVAVNLLDPTETMLRTRDEIVIGGRTVASGGARDIPEEIWHYFVMAAAVLLAIEWVLYALRMRR